MSNLTFELESGTPDHSNFRTPAVRTLLPGEMDYTEATGQVTIADRGATVGKEWAGIVPNGRAVLKVANPAYDAGGSDAVSHELGEPVYAARTTIASAFNATTNPYSSIVFASSASSVFLGYVDEIPVRITEPYIYIRFDKKLFSAVAAAAT